MKRTRRTGLLKTLLLGGALTGCAAEVGSGPELDEVVANDQPLLVRDTALWTNPTINVCWKRFADSTAQERKWAQDAVTREFESISNLDFIGWGECTAAGAQIVIDVKESNWPEAEVGSRTAAATPNIKLNFFKSNPPTNNTYFDDFPDCFGTTLPVTGDTGRTWTSQQHKCIDNIAVHEFAHLLGISHEQNRTDTPADCGGPGASTYTPFGYWDWSSISNYCNPVWNNDGRLSVLDVAGIQEYYGSPANDHLWISLGNLRDYSGTEPTTDLMTFETRRMSVATGYQPLSGDFNGDGIDDIFWYRAGTNSDSLWLFDSEGGHSSISQTVNGTYVPLVGDFNGDGRSDVMWYSPGAGNDQIWFFNGDASHSSRSEEVNGTYTAFTGDFNGDDRTDIFWYRPGSLSESIWFFNADKTHSERSEDVGGTYQPFAGDFDGDGNDDVFWYRPGTDSDPMWYFASNKSHTSTSVNVNNTYQPKVGDFDGDTRDDILWFRTGSAGDGVWLGTSTRGSFISTPTRYDGGGVPVTGDFNGDFLDDVFFYE